MIVKRPAAERGHMKIDWLDTWHTFSFGDYYDPVWMGFGPLRVINDDRVAAGAGFPTHPHRDMEILTLVLEGELQHRDSMGNGTVIRPGDVQKMSAGTGVRHSEFNPSPDRPVHLLQIWIIPDTMGLKPGYQQEHFKARPGEWQVLATRDGREGSIIVRQDVSLHHAALNAGDQVNYSLPPGRAAWVHVATGRMTLNGTELAAGDGAAVTAESLLTFAAEMPGEVLLFDLVQ